MTIPSFARPIVKWLLRALALAAAAVFLVVLLFALQARSRLPALATWHHLRLREEFRAGLPSVKSFEDYLRLEDRLFAELHEKLLDDPALADPFSLGRYHAGSAAARRAWETPYNRSFELKRENP